MSEEHHISPQNYVQSLIDKLRKMGVNLVFESLNLIPFCFSGDGLAVFGRNLGFLKDDRFMTAYKYSLSRFEVPEVRKILQSIIWRKHIACSLASQAIHIEGDFVECGVEWGVGVDVMTQYLEFSTVNKKWYLYDTFYGVPDDNCDEGFEVSNTVTKKSQYERVKSKFSAIDNVVIVQGILPQSLQLNCPAKISFLHIDLNNVIGEIAVFAELYSKVSIGGIILFDDYGMVLFAKQHSVQRAYFKNLGLVFTELPTGQALLVKAKELDFNVDESDLLINYDFEEYIDQTRPFNDLIKESGPINYEEISQRCEYLKNQLSYIKRFSETCDEQELVDLLESIHKQYNSNSVRIENDIITYKTWIELNLTTQSEIVANLQGKIDALRLIIDNQCK